MASHPAQLLDHIRRLVADPARVADAVLLSRFVQLQDQEAFAALVAQHGAMVYRLCRRVLSDAQAAEDCFQAVFLVLARKAATLRRPERLAGWLFGVAHRIALKARAAEQRRRIGETQKFLADRARAAGGPLDEITAQEALRILDEEIQRLPETYRIPVILCCVEGRTQEEAARELGWTMGSLQGRLERGRARLHGRLSRRGLGLSAALGTLELSRGVAPALPALLTSKTVEAAMLFAVGSLPAAARISAQALALADGGVKSMTAGKMHIAIALLVGAGLMAGGAGVLGFQGVPAPPPEQKQEVGTRRVKKPAPSAPAADVSRARIEGAVVDEADKAVTGAIVSVIKAGLPTKQATTRTGTDGSFRLVFDAPSAAFQAVLATTAGGEKQGYLFTDRNVGAVATVRIVLKPSRSLTVRVTNAQKKPLQAASVGVFGVETILATAVTDAKGLASMRLPAHAQVHQVIALKPGAGFDYYENYRSWPSRNPTHPPPASMDLTLNGAQNVQVEATETTGKALADIELVPMSLHKKGKLSSVNLTGAEAVPHLFSQTDQRGVALFAWIPLDLKEGFSVVQRNPDYHLPDQPSFNLSRPESLLSARLLRNVSISGKVMLPDGNPAAGILIQAAGRGNTNMDGWGEARTKPNGSYNLLVYPNQSYLIAVTDDQWAAPSKAGVVLREGERRAGVDFRLGRGTLLRGKLTTGADRKPLADEYVTLIQQGSEIPPEYVGNWAPKGSRERLVRQAVTDRAGRYSIRPSPGEYKLLGPNVPEQDLVVKAEESIEKDFHVERPPRRPFSGVVVARTVDGRYVPRAFIKGRSMVVPYAAFEAVADDEGRFQAELWREPMHLHVRDPGGKLATMITIGAEDSEVKITLIDAGTLRGRVVGKTRQPLAGVRLVCVLEIGPKTAPHSRIDLQAMTDGTGRFTFPGIVPGTRCSVHAYNDHVSGPSKEVLMEQAVEVDLRDVVFDSAEE